ncbi:hypothetical protein SPRG_12831 [Saprolegnia parasitica CBS 223.65]|uniref:Mitochondrial carrier protein n=1 Tax=Saprolegnia parasitica (strain CBS 223.65) TaxID=695850 RepID=A0A067BYN5_SAPPC|nr:hypothetical protein SPRG_12831 [Saprolegnia parasitica CBS 223.65]KDO21965.1 hypothetical protein SPRG_12831 [Saprolegnia parasitica CBS 223.65]|eukprot:XP_012207307.1 hypothetical protein SPRG_12831 [Saprolegnia parasitica CBS 223.65]
MPSSTKLSGGQSVVAGVFAGCVTRSCTSPMDVLKIRLQATASTNMARPSLHQAISTLRATCRNIYATTGVAGLWRGNLAGCLRLGPYCGIKFCVYDALHDAKHPRSGMVDGAIAGMAATMAVYPMEVVRTRLIISAPSRGICGSLRELYVREGLRGLYRGGLTGVVGAIPFEGLQFACYEFGRGYAVTHRWPAWRWTSTKTELSPIDILVTGSLSGIVAQLAAYPFDTIKKRLQAQDLGSSRQYTGLLDCARRVVANEGVGALYRGSLPNLLRIGPYAAIMFASYEAAKSYLAADHRHHHQVSTS